ncbi:MAG TPA: PmoA family protein [Blastocatellia bacterium]|nr:PmoA family protein [Blastocatellia bacterium]
MKRILSFALILNLLIAPAASASGRGVKIVENREKKQLDVYIDGELFTSYCFWDDQKKPILYPLKTAKGTVVTRSFPITKVAGERTDHPHHISSWFTYGNVNGADFWNTPSDGVKGEPNNHLGRIRHRAVRAVKNGSDSAQLEVTADWIMPDGSKVLQQDETIIFRGGKDVRAIDRIITLTAQDKKVVFGDTKEGALGIRVARQLEEPADKPEVFTDANGNPTKVPVLDNTGVDGKYLSSEGKVGEKEAWGTRARWMTLSGAVKGEDVVIGIFDHPKNPTYPTYWHARGYGLFAANPFGAKDFTKGAQTLNYTLQPGEKLTLRFRILIHSGKLTKEQTEALYQQFLKEVRQ